MTHRLRVGTAWFVLAVVLMFRPLWVGAEESKSKPEDTTTTALEMLDLQSLVQDALKVPTTVPEAPAIVSVMTAEQMQMMGYRTLSEALGTLPGIIVKPWFGVPWTKGLPVQRGSATNPYSLLNGIPMVDLLGGSPTMATIGHHSVSRVEILNGPGGVLWGADSYAGVISIVTKTADDLEGLEISAGYGSGVDEVHAFRAYAMYGKKLLSGRLKVFAHVNYETMYAPAYEVPYHAVTRLVNPQPEGQALLTGPDTVSSHRDHVTEFSGNVQFDNFSFYWATHPVTRVTLPVTINSSLSRAVLDEDRIDCSNPANKAICSLRVDPDRLNRSSITTTPRHIFQLRHRSRVLGDKLGIVSRVYYVGTRQNPWDKQPLIQIQFLSSSFNPDGGVRMNIGRNFYADTVGAAVDADYMLPGNSRLMLGGDIVHERSFMDADFTGTNPDLLKMSYQPCKRDANGDIYIEDGVYCSFPTIEPLERSRLGVFANLNTRVFKGLGLDAGIRGQFYHSPDSEIYVPPTVVSSGAAVWSFLPNWNLKVTFNEGFRPPNPTALSTGKDWGPAGSKLLKPERSRALQGEVNARLLEGRRGIRRLELRLNYGYTWFLDRIVVSSATEWRNIGRTGVHSIEALVDVLMEKWHKLSIGYSFLDVSDSLFGKIRSLPNQWVSSQARFNLWKRHFWLTTSLLVFGSSEDPNKYPATPGPAIYIGRTENGVPVQSSTWVSTSTDQVIERVPPFAFWTAGVRVTLPRWGLEIDGDVYNILNVQGYAADDELSLTGHGWYEVPRPISGGTTFFTRLRYKY